MHEPVIDQIHPIFLCKIELIPCIVANLQHESMRTSRIDRCKPCYAGTEFTNRDEYLARTPRRRQMKIIQDLVKDDPGIGIS